MNDADKYQREADLRAASAAGAFLLGVFLLFLWLVGATPGILIGFGVGWVVIDLVQGAAALYKSAKARQ